MLNRVLEKLFGKHTRRHPLVIPPTEFEAERLLSHWTHLVDEEVEVLGMSFFGDWFLRRPDEHIARLDLLEGTCEPIAPTEASFWERMDTPDIEDDWLVGGLVRALESEGAIRERGECFQYRVHPRLGGSFERSNIGLGKIAGWQLWCAQLHAKLDQLPDGTVVVGLEMGPDGELEVRTKS